MISRTVRNATARLALAAMLFAQMALAAAACESVRRAPALAVALAAASGGDATCHEQDRNANLCLAHCLGEDQSLDKPLAKLPVLSSASALPLPTAFISPHDARAPRRLAVPHAPGPPARILFQSLLI